MLPGQLAHVNLCVSQDIALGSCILAAWPAMLVTPAGTLWMPQSSVCTQTNTRPHQRLANGNSNSSPNSGLPFADQCALR